MSQSDQDDYWNGRAGLPTHGAYGETGRRDAEEERRARDEAIQRAIARPAKSAPAYFRPSWTPISADHGRHFRLNVDAVSS